MSYRGSDRTVTVERVGIVGYGEVGRIFAEAMLEVGLEVSVRNRSPKLLRRRLSSSAITVVDSYAELAKRTDLVLSCVWPATAIEVATRVAPGLTQGQPYLDLNSVSPTTSERIVNIVENADGMALKGAIMGSVSSEGAGVRVALAGTDSSPVGRLLETAGFAVKDLGTDTAAPAALKIFRSMLTKGLRQLAVETLVPAMDYGVHEEVLDNVSGLFAGRPLDKWLITALENTPAHAERRLGELEQIREAVTAAGYRAPTLAETTELHRQLCERSIDDDYLAVLTALEPHYSTEKNSSARSAEDNDGNRRC